MDATLFNERLDQLIKDLRDTLENTEHIRYSFDDILDDREKAKLLEALENNFDEQIDACMSLMETQHTRLLMRMDRIEDKLNDLLGIVSDLDQRRKFGKTEDPSIKK